MHLPIFGRLEAKIREIYSTYAPSLVAYARSFGLDRHSAEDVVHHVFLSVLENSKYPDEPRPYLFRAVRNSALNHHRRYERTEALEEEPWFSSGNHNRESELDLRRSLKTLPPDQLDVLVLHVWGGLSFEEVGKVLDISHNTAASRYRYALGTLKRKLHYD